MPSDARARVAVLYAPSLANRKSREQLMRDCSAGDTGVWSLYVADLPAVAHSSEYFFCLPKLQLVLKMFPLKLMLPEEDLEAAEGGNGEYLARPGKVKTDSESGPLPG